MLVSAFRTDFAYPAGAATLVEQMLPAFFIDVGPKCNFDCPFCSVPRRNTFFPRAQVEQLVTQAGRAALGRGFFTGGEPSIYPDLEQVIRHGRRHGVQRYGMSTNGSGLTDPARVRTLTQLGLTAWQLSWDDVRPDVLDRLRGHAGAWDLLQRALDALARLEQSQVSVNQVVVRDNHATVPDMVAHVARLRERFGCVGWLLVSLVKPVGAALTHRDVLFPYEQAVPHLYRAIDLAEQARLPLVLNNVPACLIPERPEYGCSSFEHLRLVDTDTHESLPMRFPGYGLRKNAACLRCRQFERCNGYWSAYVDAFGDDIYRPTGPLVREHPLPSSRLDEERRLGESLAQRLARSQAPQDRQDDTHAPAPVAPGDEPDRERQAQLEQVLGGEWSDGWALHEVRLSVEAQTSVARATFAGPPAVRRLEVVVAPTALDVPAYRRTKRLLVWHAGADLEPAAEQQLRRVCTRIEAHEAELVRALGTGRD